MADEPAAPENAPVDTPPTEPENTPVGGGDETVTVPKSEVDALRREVAESRRRAKKAEADAAKAAEERKKEEGKWQELAEENERKAAEAERRLVEHERRQRVTAAASRLNFHDPADAYGFLTDEERDDDQRAEAALKRISKEKPYLVNTQPKAPGLEKILENGKPVTQGSEEPAPGLERLRHAYSNTE